MSCSNGSRTGPSWLITSSVLPPCLGGCRRVVLALAAGSCLRVSILGCSLGFPHYGQMRDVPGGTWRLEKEPNFGAAFQSALSLFRNFLLQFQCFFSRKLLVSVAVCCRRASDLSVAIDCRREASI